MAEMTKYEVIYHSAITDNEFRTFYNANTLDEAV